MIIRKMIKTVDSLLETRKGDKLTTIFGRAFVGGYIEGTCDILVTIGGVLLLSSIVASALGKNMEITWTDK